MQTIKDLAETILSVSEAAELAWKPGELSMASLITRETQSLLPNDQHLICILLSRSCWNDSLAWADIVMNEPFSITPYNNWDMSKELV